MAKVVHDGSDYKQRQRILPHYQIMALSKKRLKFTVILHFMLAALMIFKLVPTVLDLLNIFWQPLEELYIPMARTWEWIWISGLLVCFILLRAIKTNNNLQLKLSLLGIIVTCIFPITYCAFLYSSDFRTFIITRDATRTSEVWKDYPVALYWYVFIVVAAQVHGFELFFIWELIRSMKNKHK